MASLGGQPQGVGRVVWLEISLTHTPGVGLHSPKLRNPINLTSIPTAFNSEMALYTKSTSLRPSAPGISIDLALPSEAEARGRHLWLVSVSG